MEIKTDLKGKSNKTISIENSAILLLNESEFFEDIPDFSSKVELTIKEYVTILKHSAKEIKELFTVEEMKLLLDACNMIMLINDEISPALTIHNSLVFHCTNFNISLNPALENKVLNLTVAQSHTLLRSIFSYWQDTDFKKVSIFCKGV